MEELWRRNLGQAYHGAPPQLVRRSTDCFDRDRSRQRERHRHRCRHAGLGLFNAPQASENLERLLVEPIDLDGDAPAAADDADDRHANRAPKEREFEEFAKYKFGKLSKAKQAEAERRWASKGPEVEGLLPETYGFKEVKLVKCEADAPY